MSDDSDSDCDFSVRNTRSGSSADEQDSCAAGLEGASVARGPGSSVAREQRGAEEEEDQTESRCVSSPSTLGGDAVPWRPLPPSTQQSAHS